jgi:crotonobetainyl-CoA:carnitine CoA-transferase CaiB-like acyl-CoA transferase
MILVPGVLLSATVPHFKSCRNTVQGGESTYFLSINRNKKSVVIDMKHKDGLQVLHDLAAQCDVAIENFPPGKANKLGVGYDTLSKINPKIIYASISGYF